MTAIPRSEDEPSSHRIPISDDELFAEEGGIYHLDFSERRDRFLSDTLRIFLVRVAMRQRNHGLGPRPLNLRAAYVNNANFNATAFQMAGWDAICINMGLVEPLIQIFKKATDLPFVRSGIRNSHLSSKNLGRLMLRQALLMFWQHECGHIIHGHVGWLSETLGFFRYSELHASTAISGGMSLQTFEMDADSVGVLDLYSSSMTWRGGADHQTWSLGSFKEDLFLIIYVLGVAFGFMAKPLSSDPYDLLERSHPPGWYRLQMQVEVLHAVIQKDFPERHDDFLKIVDPAIDAVSKTLIAIDQNYAKRGFTLNDITIPDAYRQNLAEEWNRLRPELDLLRKGGVLAPPHEV